MSASHRNWRTAVLATASVAALLLPQVVTAQAPPAAQQPPATQPPAAAPPLVPPAEPAPSAAVAAVIADAQAKIKAGQFAEAVAVLTAAETPGLPAADKQALDFAIASAQSAWGTQLLNARQLSDALTHLESAVLIDSAAATRLSQYASDLQHKGIAYYFMGQNEKAITYFEQALLIDREVKNRKGEANALTSFGIAYDQLNQYEKAIGYYEQALPIYRDVKDRDGEANALTNLGAAFASLSQYEKAIGYFKQVLPIFQQIKDRNGEANALNNLSVTYLYLSQYEKAIGYLEQALPIYKEVNNRDYQGHALTNLGKAYERLNQYEKAIRYDEQALSIYREVKDRDGEANALNSLGAAYEDLSQYVKAIGYFEQALPIYREVEDRTGEANALKILGDSYQCLSQYVKAIGYYEQALPIYREVKVREGEARALDSLGGAYGDLSQFDKAIRYFEQALVIDRNIKHRNFEANALCNLGAIYLKLTQYAKSIGYLEQALTIFREVKDRDGEADALTNLETAWANPKNPSRSSGLAILFGKQAVNTLQSIRSDIHGIDKAIQKGFAKSKEQTYRDLADLLIVQHRLPEALQVLDLLKQEEYLNFSKQAPGRANTDNLLAKAVDLTPREMRWDKALKAAGDSVARDEAQQDELAHQKEPTPQQKQKLATLSSKVAADNAAYQKTLTDLTADLRHKPDPAQDRLPNTSNARDLQAALRSLGHGSAALYTLATDKNIDLLLVTRNRLAARTVPLASPADLDRKIVAFRAVLQDPYSDPRPLGKHLYDLLIAPIHPDLDRTHAKTLLVSLDGNLRYIPLAALSPDGKKHYLVETYRTALYTPAALANLTRQPSPHWTALAMGVSQPHEGFRELTAVPGELKAVARTGGESGPDAGLFPGTRLLDAAFTRDAMLSALRTGNGGGYPLVHVASHFVFTGEESTSFLLLGDGAHLTLTDLKNLPEGVFAGVNLLTLSACETATGRMNEDTDNSGRDVENVAVLAQRKGADAVLASLWSVSDESTGLLMRTFYRDRQGGGSGGTGESKAEALRQAQIALLTGTAKSRPNALAPKRSELLEPAPKSAATASAPAFVPDPARPWAHPYYWAPFILIGNGK